MGVAGSASTTSRWSATNFRRNLMPRGSWARPRTRLRSALRAWTARSPSRGTGGAPWAGWSSFRCRRGWCTAGSPRRERTASFSMSRVSSASSASPNSGQEGFRWNSAATIRGSLVDIDLSALRSLESEKDISMELVIKAIEDALLVAYHRTDGAAPVARVELDRKSGHVTVWAAQTDAEGELVREYDDTPSGFGR